MPLVMFVMTNAKNVKTPNKMKLEIPTVLDKELQGRFENYLKRNKLFFKKKLSGGTLYYTIEILEPITAYWIGCNMVALQERLYDSSITSTL